MAKYALYVGGFDENPSVWQDRHAFFLSLSGKQEQKRNPLLLLFYFNRTRAGTVRPLSLRARKAALHGSARRVAEGVDPYRAPTARFIFSASTIGGGGPRQRWKEFA